MFSTDHSRVTVIIPCHNYSRYLGECLQSVLGQTHTPDEIIVIDDSSTDNPETIVGKFNAPNLKLIQVKYKNHYQAIREGILGSSGEYICKVDADDTIDPFYLERGIKKFKEDYRIGIVYSDLEYRGLMQGRTCLPESSLVEDYHRINFIHGGSIFRKVVAVLTKAFDEQPGDDSSVEWVAWRKIIDNGYWAVKQSSKYFYRRHELSLTTVRSWDSKPPGYFEIAGLDEEKLTIAMVINENQERWLRQKEFLKEQEWKRSTISLLIVCLTGNEVLIERLRREVLDLAYEDIRFVTIPAEEGRSDIEKEYTVFTTIADEVDTPYLLYIDQSIIPPSNIVQKLMHAVCEHTLSVCSEVAGSTAMNVSNYELLHKGMPLPGAVHRVISNSFSCVLLRSCNFKEVFSEVNMSYDLCGISPERYFYSRIKNNMYPKLNQEVVSEYIGEVDEILRSYASPRDRFDEEYYFNRNPDVKISVEKGEFSSGYEHYLNNGKREGRDAFFYE
jgi:glycosyltransferase involved in cell wall biosynthesis